MVRRSKTKTNQPQETENPTREFQPEELQPTRVVGIGASAGGLEALEEFFKALTLDTGMAFVVIQHLSPDFKSLMDELLGRITTMRILRMEESRPLEANTIYLMPPRCDLTIEGNLLVVTDREPGQQLHMPINLFFKSLAHGLQEQAIAIVLSGSGSDGGVGVAEVHDNGGVVLVQRPDTAKFDGMPRNAIATGFVDAVGSPSELAELIVKLGKDPATELLIPMHSDGSGEDGVGLILQVLQASHGIDFSLYKTPTIIRRLERRMMVNRVSSLEEYLKLLERSFEEREALYQHLLIGVTRFFRDTEAFELISTQILPELVASLAKAADELRIWVPGCATGEEAYSIAMLALKEMGRQGKAHAIRIFATDVHQDSLAIAAAGVYSLDSVESVPADLLAEFFVEEPEGNFRVSSRLRKTVLFSTQNLLRDVPFNRIDFVSCRNLLIYFLPEAQNRALTAFHFALNLHGYLLLGPSESLAGMERDFEIIDQKWKVFRKTTEDRVSMEPRTFLPARVQAYSHRARKTLDIGFNRIYDQLLDEFLPPSILVGEKREVVHVVGCAKNYLRVPAGRLTTDVISLLEGDLRVAVASAIQNCIRHQEKVLIREVTLDDKRLDLVAQPLKDPLSERCYVLLQFVENDAAATPEPVRPLHLSAGIRDRVESLESELELTRESLQATMEEMEVASEELQATNEELLSSNEELQSTNEELHSVNEELYTVNAEHEHQIDNLERVSNDLRNLIRSTNIGVIFLDTTLHIRMFTPLVTVLYNLLPQDVGRDLRHITSNFQDANLNASLEKVLDSQAVDARQVTGLNGERYQQRIMPYLDEEGATQGVVLTYVDVSELTAIRQALSDQKQALDEHAIVSFIDSNGIITYVNQKFCDTSGYSREELIGSRHYLFDSDQSFEGNRKHMLNAVRNGKVWRGEFRKTAKNAGSYWVDATICPLLNSAGKPYQFVAIYTDITSRKQAEAMRDDILSGTSDLIEVVSSQGRYLYVNRAWQEALGYSEAEAKMLSVFQVVQPESWKASKETLERLATDRVTELLEVTFLTKSGKSLHLEGNVSARVENGVVVSTRGIFRDITARKQAELSLRESEAKYRRLWDSNRDAQMLCSPPEWKISLVNPAAISLFGARDSEQLMTLSMADLSPEYQPDGKRSGLKLQQRINDVLQGESHTFECLCQTLGGSEFWGLVTLSQTEEKEVTGVQVTIRDISERQQLTEQLKQRLRERETLLLEVHHRVKNNLNVISSLLSLQQRRASQPEVAAEFQRTRDRIAAIGLVHEQLLGSHALDRVDFIPFVRQLGHNVLVAANETHRIRLTVEGEGFSYELQRAVPCALLLNELITNAIKHAFPDNRTGLIAIILQQAPDGSRQITVRDDGIGMDPEHCESDSLGMRLMDRLIDQLGGTLERLIEPIGTGYRITLTPDDS